MRVGHGLAATSMAPAKDQARNLGMCPDWEVNHQPFSAQTTPNLSHILQGYIWRFY